MPRIRKRTIPTDDTLRRLDVEIKRVELEVAKERLEELRESRWKKPVAAVLMACLGLFVSIATGVIVPVLSRPATDQMTASAQSARSLSAHER
jgi:hypothetical protein